MQQNKTEALDTTPVGKLLFHLAVPAIAAQVINLLYNLVDRMYIGYIPETGALALTGVGVCLPLIMIISAFAALAGMGSAPRASIFLGQKDTQNAERVLGNAATALSLIALILTVVFLLFSEPLLLLFGASENTIGYALSYMRIYAMGTLFVQMTLGLNPFITAQGFSTTSMYTVLIGAVLNIGLDPLFIFTFGMGVSGAALATILSQAVSMIWILHFLTGKKTNLHLRRANLRLDRAVLLPCLALGLSPFIMQATESLIAVCFNASLLRYGGDIAVGAMTILTSVMQFSMLPLMGLTQGAQPIISYAYGAQEPDRVKQAFLLLLICCLTFSTLIWLVAMFAPHVFIQIFTPDETLIAFTIRALRIYMGTTLLFGAQVACQQTFLALGDAKNSLFLALLRKILLLIPLIYLLPLFLADKTDAVFLAEPIADFLAVSTTVLLFSARFRKTLASLRSPAKP